MLSYNNSIVGAWQGALSTKIELFNNKFIGRTKKMIRSFPIRIPINTDFRPSFNRHNDIRFSA